MVDRQERRYKRREQSIGQRSGRATPGNLLQLSYGPGSLDTTGLSYSLNGLMLKSHELGIVPLVLRVLAALWGKFCREKFNMNTIL